MTGVSNIQFFARHRYNPVCIEHVMRKPESTNLEAGVKWRLAGKRHSRTSREAMNGLMDGMKQEVMKLGVMK